MSGLCSEDFMKLSIQDVADLLLEKLDETGNNQSGAKLFGCSEGKMFELSLSMRCVENE